MLDKSVPYAGLFMRRAAGPPSVYFPLPDGFEFSFFRDGDEVSWAKIEASALEFDSESEALIYYKEKFIPFAEQLYTRCLFIEHEGKKIATATAWHNEINGERRAWLHWVAVMSEYQGLGLGKALVSRVTELMRELDGDVDFYLRTQTWSYTAINIYKTHGFEPTDEKALYIDRNDNYKKALRILGRIEKKRRRELSARLR